jgi:hypothetical protein
MKVVTFVKAIQKSITCVIKALKKADSFTYLVVMCVAITT